MANGFSLLPFVYRLVGKIGKLNLIFHYPIEVFKLAMHASSRYYENLVNVKMDDSRNRIF